MLGQVSEAIHQQPIVCAWCAVTALLFVAGATVQFLLHKSVLSDLVMFHSSIKLAVAHYFSQTLLVAPASSSTEKSCSASENDQ